MGLETPGALAIESHFIPEVIRGRSSTLPLLGRHPHPTAVPSPLSRWIRYWPDAVVLVREDTTLSDPSCGSSSRSRMVRSAGAANNTIEAFADCGYQEVHIFEPFLLGQLAYQGYQT